MSNNTIRKATPLDLTLLLLLTIIWGSGFIAIKVAVPQTGPVWLAASRVCIGFLVLLPWFFYRGLVLPASRKSWGHLFVISILNVTVPFILISWAELTISAGVTSLLLGFGPLMALIFAHLTTDDDKINRHKLIGLVLGFFGISLIIGGEAFTDLGGETFLAQLAVIGATLCYASSGAMIRKINDVPPVRLASLILGLASIQLVAVGFYYGPPDFTAISFEAWFSILYLGLLPTGLATILRYRLIWSIGASFYTLGLNLIPVVGILLGALILSEKDRSDDLGGPCPYFGWPFCRPKKTKTRQNK